MLVFTYISVRHDFIQITFDKLKLIMLDYHEQDNIIVQKSLTRLIKKSKLHEEKILKKILYNQNGGKPGTTLK